MASEREWGTCRSRSGVSFRRGRPGEPNAVLRWGGSVMNEPPAGDAFYRKRFSRWVREVGYRNVFCVRHGAWFRNCVVAAERGWEKRAYCEAWHEGAVNEGCKFEARDREQVKYEAWKQKLTAKSPTI